MPESEPLIAVVTGECPRRLIDRQGRVHRDSGRIHADVPVLRVDAPAALAVRTGRSTGSQAVYAGHVRHSGDWSDLLPFARAANTFTAVACPGGRPPPAPASAPRTARHAVAVLGAPNDEHGNLSVMAAGRVECAAELAVRRPGAALVLTGGQGPQFNTTDRPHWQHCLAHLRDRGLGGLAVLAFVDSRHTYEDLLLVKQATLARQFDSITVVTSDYHLARVSFLAGLVLPHAVIQGVRTGQGPAENGCLANHERQALGRVVAAALLFGPDRLLRPPTRTVFERTDRWLP